MSVRNRTLLLNRKRAYRDQHGRCFWCDVRMMRPHDPGFSEAANQPRRLTAEHLIPQSQTADSAKHSWWNIVAACWRCNNERGNMSIEQWVSALLPRLNEALVAVLLAKLATFGIKLPIGHPALAAPNSRNPIVRAPQEDAQAP